MDPLNALGLAAGVVQFADYATKRCQAVMELYDQGNEALMRGSVFAKIATDFIEFSTGLEERKKLASGDGTGSQLQQTDEVSLQVI